MIELAMLYEAQTKKDVSRKYYEQAIKIDGRVALRLQRRDGRFTLKFYQLDKKAQREITEEILELAERRVRERLKGDSLLAALIRHVSKAGWFSGRI